MPYPTIPGRKFNYDVGGGSVYRGSSPTDLSSALSTDQMSKLNGFSNSSNAAIVASNYSSGVRLVLWVFLPHKYTVSGLGLLHDSPYVGGGSGSLSSVVIHGSANTTNGLDGTWIPATLPNGSVPGRLMNDDDWRAKIQSCSFSESIRCLRIDYISSSYYGVSVHALHIYGTKTAGEVVDDILFMDDDATNDPEFIRDLDLGDRPEGTTTTRRIKLFNSSPDKFANNVFISLQDPQIVVSIDEGVTWITNTTIASMAPQSYSGSIIIKDTIPPPTQMLGPSLARIEAYVGTWTT